MSDKHCCRTEIGPAALSYEMKSNRVPQWQKSVEMTWKCKLTSSFQSKIIINLGQSALLSVCSAENENVAVRKSSLGRPSTARATRLKRSQFRNQWEHTNEDGWNSQWEMQMNESENWLRRREIKSNHGWLRDDRTTWLMSNHGWLRDDRTVQGLKRRREGTHHDWHQLNLLPCTAIHVCTLSEWSCAIKKRKCRNDARNSQTSGHGWSWRWCKSHCTIGICTRSDSFVTGKEVCNEGQMQLDRMLGLLTNHKQSLRNIRKRNLGQKYCDISSCGGDREMNFR